MHVRFTRSVAAPRRLLRSSDALCSCPTSREPTAGTACSQSCRRAPPSPDAAPRPSSWPRHRRRWVGAGPDGARLSGSARTRGRHGLSQGPGYPQGQRHGHDRRPRGERRGADDGQGRGDGSARAGQLPPRRDPVIQPGRAATRAPATARRPARAGSGSASAATCPTRIISTLTPRGRRPADQPARAPRRA